MAETQVVPAPVATPTDPKQASTNITKGVQDKSTGKVLVQDGPNKPQPAETDPNAGKKKYVVDGKERWLSSQEADSYVQKGLAFEPKISELARMRQEMQQFEQALLTNPGMILANIAKKKNVPISSLVQNVLDSNISDEVKEATGKWYWERVAMRERMEPHERENLELKEENEKLKMSDKKKADMSIVMENKVKVVKAMGEVSAQIQETLGELGIKNVDSVAGIRVAREIADVMRLSFINKQPCTAKVAAGIVKARMLEQQKEFYDDLDAENLVNQLGKENVEKIRKHLLKMVQDVEKGTRQESVKGTGQVPRRNERKTMNMDEFHEQLADLKRNNK